MVNCEEEREQRCWGKRTVLLLDWSEGQGGRQSGRREGWEQGSRQASLASL